MPGQLVRCDRRAAIPANERVGSHVGDQQANQQAAGITDQVADIFPRFWPCR